MIKSLTKIFKGKKNATEIPGEAIQLLDDASKLEEEARIDEAIVLYHKIIKMAPAWATPYYNLGLIYKYQSDWKNSFKYNKKAAELDTAHEASWWNLGIAATALKDWRTARQAWNVFGLNLEINDNEINLEIGRTPVRLNPNDDAEVVWCTRIDPARTIIINVPLPESNHRYYDLLLNDGAPVGERISDGVTYSVFNELQLLEKSNYKTFSTIIYTDNQTDVEKLAKLCDDEEVGFEDWSTIRLLCKKCSEGIPHDHHGQERKVSDKGERHIGFAAVDIIALQQIMTNWAIITLCSYDEILLELE